jgi:hypothetical protein
MITKVAVCDHCKKESDSSHVSIPTDWFVLSVEAYPQYIPMIKEDLRKEYHLCSKDCLSKFVQQNIH